ncbi:MAG: MFS transporter [Ectothiorhodospiraceae bacterium]
MGPISEQRLDRAYRVLSGDDSDERACEAIADSACTALPRNYVLNVVNGACTKLAEQIAGPNLVLPWMLAAVGAPASIIGFLMPVKQVFSLVPQLAISGQIRRVARRKWVWVGAGGIQAVALLAMAAAAAVLGPVAAGLSVVLLLALFSAASGAGSVAFQDVTAKTVPKGRRGMMLSNRAFIGGILTILAGGILQFRLNGGEAGAVYFALIVTAAILWALAALVFMLVREDAGATEGGRNPLHELAAGLALMRAQPGYRRFLTARALLLSVELAAPFYALYGQTLFTGMPAALGAFVLCIGLGNVLSSPIWGRFSDHSSRTVMALSGALAAATAALALVVGTGPEALASPYLYALVFVVLGVAEQGVRLGRKTYLVDAAPADERPLYVAFANTGIGLLALVGGGLGAVSQWLGAPVALLFLGALGMLGALACRAMPEAANMLEEGVRA